MLYIKVNTEKQLDETSLSIGNTIEHVISLDLRFKGNGSVTVNIDTKDGATKQQYKIIYVTQKYLWIDLIKLKLLKVLTLTLTFFYFKSLKKEIAVTYCSIKINESLLLNVVSFDSELKLENMILNMCQFLKFFL